MSTNYIDQITDTAGTTHDISEGDSTRIFRATCPTTASTAAKVATLQTSDRNFSLATGVRVAVTFTYGNSAATPTLNVNNTGAKNIAVATSATAKATGNGTTYNTWGPYETVLFTYDGTYWVNEGSSLSIYNSYNYNNLSNKPTLFSGNYNDLTNKPTIPTLPSNIVNTITTTEGAHTTITSKTGDVSFKVPTKTSHLTNDSGFITSAPSYEIATNTTAGLVKPWYYWQQSSTGPTAGTINASATVNARSATAGRYYAVEMDKDGRMFVNVPWENTATDTQVTSTAVTANSTYYLTGSSSSTTETGTLNKHASITAYVTADSNTSGSAYISIGNSTASGTAGAKYGYLRLYGTTAYYHQIQGYTGYPAANRTIYLPRYAGTMYLTCVSTTAAVGGSNNPVYVNNTGRILAGNTFVPNTGGSFTGDVSMAGTTAYTTANVKNIVESTDAPGTASDYPTGTVWLQYGASPPADRADYVVEQGASGIWTYRKWNSGISECWGSKTFTGVNVSTAWGNIYYGTVTTTSQTTYPSGLFLSTPISQFNLRSSGGRFWYTHQIDSSATNVGQIYAIAPTSYTNQSIDLQVYSMGKWK